MNKTTFRGIWQASAAKYLVFFLLIGLLAWQTDPLPAPPSWFPAMKIPEDNAITPERWALGKRLFYDVAMSPDSTIACATCHKPEFAFADTAAVTPGRGGLMGRRNAPTLTNAGYFKAFHAEGGVPTLEMQVLVPVQEMPEMGTNIVAIAQRLSKNAEYQGMSQAAYGRPLDAWVITRAIASFERTLTSGRSKYDRYFYEGETDLFTESEKRGRELFFSDELGCFKCHSGLFFTDFEAYNIGLYDEYKDPGRFRLTNDPADWGAFKTPTLRNIAVTAPYMHDGSMRTLEEVIDHYATGGKPQPSLSFKMSAFTITPDEKADLIAFLHTFTDSSFIQNPAFRQ